MGKNKRKYPDQSEEDKAKKKLAKLQKSKKTESAVVQEIKSQAAAVIESRKNSNHILEIINYLEVDTAQDEASAAVKALKRIFTIAIEKHELSDETEKEEMSADEKYKVWMRERFDEMVKKLCGLIHHRKGSVSNLTIATLMTLIQQFWASNKDSSDANVWGQKEKEILNNITLSIISNKNQSKAVISRFQEHLLYADVKFYFLKNLSRIIGVALKKPDKANLVFIENTLAFLEAVNMSDVEADKSNTLLCKNINTGETRFRLHFEEMKKHFSNCWLQILKCRITMDQYKRVLLIIDDKILPYMSKPLLLTDFLMSSYNVGGSISLLALSGVFTLISKYNLEYPEFYTKLYQLFTPELLHVKYRARFFHLANIFLSSTHLPAYLVAAFIKRLSRLCLSAPSNTIPMVIRFIHNLIHRHPSLVKMIDNPETDAVDETYDHQETDPSKCGAISSSLWEIVSLQEHVLPQVSSVAKDLIEKGLREMELDFSSHLETTYQEMFEKETKKKIFTNVPVNWELPDGIKLAQDDIFSQIIAV